VIVRPLEFDFAAQDAEDVRSRTRWTMTTSFLLHALLLMALILIRPAAGTQESLTEITLLGPGGNDPAPAGAASLASSLPRTLGALHRETRTEHFLRRADDGAFAPDPQSASALDDQLDARLAALRTNDAAPALPSVSTSAPSALWSAPAGVPGPTGGGGSKALARGSGGEGNPVMPLGRGSSLGNSSVGRVADVAVKPPVEKAAAATESDARVGRSLAGASLTGPVANRPVVHVVTPVYPEWAKRDGVEASVTLSFVVRPDGTVKENVLVQKTAGFSDFDDSARAALSAWRFAPLRSGSTGEQWGTITFRFRLRDS